MPDIPGNRISVITASRTCHKPVGGRTGDSTFNFGALVCAGLRHNAAQNAYYCLVLRPAAATPARRKCRVAARYKVEDVMVDLVSRWGNSALMFTFLLITYAVVITLR
jgi:hypothetical protein